MAHRTDHFSRRSDRPSRFAILGDWGTTRLRLFRVEEGRVTDRATGPGIGQLGGGAEAALAAAVAPWVEQGAATGLMLCGMAGARDGWREAPYAPCPADAEAWAGQAVRFDWRGIPVAILAGLACDGVDGLPDVMRGEETQIFGACRIDPALARGRRILVLPGTHNKWCVMEDGQLPFFRTVPTGELFALLRHQSTLAPSGAVSDPVAQEDGFAEGLERAGAGKLLPSLFAARAMRLRAGRPDDWAAGYLSGILIGCEVADMLAMLGEADDITLIGDEGLTARYARALGAVGLRARMMDGDACALAGLQSAGEWA